MTQEKLITYYENKAMTVKEMWSAAYLGERGQEYIDFAMSELEAVKNGGIEALKKFWEDFNDNGLKPETIK